MLTVIAWDRRLVGAGLTMATRALRTPLGRAIGLGSAKEGVAHWWAQRLTAVALVPLLWFVIAVIALVGADRARCRRLAARPGAGDPDGPAADRAFYHAALGLAGRDRGLRRTNEGAKLALLVLRQARVALLLGRRRHLSPCCKLAFGG